MSKENINVFTERGIALSGVLFKSGRADTVLIAITGIHGNFYSNPFYNNFGDTLNAECFDFIYAITNDAYSKMKTLNMKTGKEEIIGSYNERFEWTNDDIKSYIKKAKELGYKHIYLAGHSLGANKVIHYLSETKDESVEKFLLLSPANLQYMMSGVSFEDKKVIKEMVNNGCGEKMLPFYFMGWVECIAYTAYDWAIENILDNVHTEEIADWSQVAKIEHSGALLIGTYDTFTDGDPTKYLININNHFKNPKANKLIFIEHTGHTYQRKEQKTAEKILELVKDWRSEYE